MTPSSLASPRRPARAGVALALPALALAWGCATGDGVGGEVVLGPGTGVSTGTGAVQSPVVGRWYRLVTFNDNGVLRSSETYWDFGADGNARRTTITANYSDGIADSQIATGTWRQVGTTVEVTYVTPTRGTVSFVWRIERSLDGDLLYLNDTPFLRRP